MNRPVVVIGIGEMGAVFARAYLRAGYPVYPVTREMDMGAAATVIAEPAVVLVAVAEDDLHKVLAHIPEPWRDRLGLLQNELLPRDWRAHGIQNPTVICVWFEKKQGQDVRVILPSPVYGPGGERIKSALTGIGIPCRVLGSEAELLRELILKNLYILTTNIAGLVVGGTVGELWEQHQALARNVADEVLSIQEWLGGVSLVREPMLTELAGAFAADSAHQCTGRSAPARLARALGHADAAGLAVPKLREIQAGLG